MALIDLANPTRFRALSGSRAAVARRRHRVAFAFGFEQAYFAPDDYQQGATVKIMFIHVPAAWLGMMGWGVMSARGARHAGVAASAGRCRRQDRGPARRRVHASVPGHRLAVGPPDVGHLLGMGRAADLRAGAVPDVSRRDRAVAHDRRSVAAPRAPPRSSPWSARIDLPIIKFSVDWWNTLHQPASVFRLGGPTIDPSLLVPLLVMALAFTLLFFTLHFAAMRNEIMRRRVRTLLLMQADAAEGIDDGSRTARGFHRRRLRVSRR